MTRSFRDKGTAAFSLGKPVKRLPPEMRKRAREKLAMIHCTHSLEDLRVPPGNRLEALSGNREGQHSIRINRQWRNCFRWENGEAWGVQVTDYH